MPGAQSITGSFAQVFQTPVVGWSNFVTLDRCPAPAGWTDGRQLSDLIVDRPSRVDNWNVIGFSARAQLAVVRNTTQIAYGRLPDVWLGVMQDNVIPDSSPGTPIVLPGDLSAFTRIWTKDDPAPLVAVNVDGGYVIPPTQGHIGLSYILPQPVLVRPGSQLSMMLILMPMLGGEGVGIKIDKLDYSVLLAEHG